MILYGCAMTTGSMGMNYKLGSKPLLLKTPFASYSCLPFKASLSSSQGPCQESKFRLVRGCPSLHLRVAASTPLLCGDHGSLLHAMPLLARQQRLAHGFHLVPRASDDTPPASFQFPPMTKRPKWYWRVLSCLPYLMPFHETWMYAETAYHLHPFLEWFQDLTSPFLDSLGRLPKWFLIIYFVSAYLGVVRNKRCPHFLRFHIVTGMLLEISLQVVGTTTRWLPRGLYWGKIGMHFWTAVAFGFMFTVMECIRCALMGMYADVPFIADAAYTQIPYD